jgi:hypothetical protein
MKRNISYKSKKRQRPPFVFEHTCVKSLMGDVKRKKEKKKRRNDISWKKLSTPSTLSKLITYLLFCFLFQLRG